MDLCTSFCAKYLVKAQNHLNVIQKLAYKAKCISQINGGLLMFFGNSRISWLDYEQGKNQYKKKEHNQQSSVL